MRIVKDVFVILFVTLLLLIVLDIAVRIYLFIKTDNSIYLKFRPEIEKKEEFPSPKMRNFGSYYKFVPGVYKHRISHLDPTTEIVEYDINSKGFRNAEFDDRKTQGIIRIFCFGGSSTMGANSPYETTYPYYLQRILNGKFKDKKYEIINAGLAGYSMKKIYGLFKNEVINYQPDNVTIYSAFNDASYARNLMFRKKDPLLRLHGFLYYRWMLYTVFLEKYSVMKHKNPIPFFLYKSYTPVDSYVGNLENIIRLAKEKRIRVILIKQPINVYIEVNFDKETIGSLEEKIKESSSMKEIRTYTQYLLVKHMERLGKLNNLTIVNPLDEFERNKKAYFIDEVHLSPKGNVRLAEIISEIFIDNAFSNL